MPVRVGLAKWWAFPCGSKHRAAMWAAIWVGVGCLSKSKAKIQCKEFSTDWIAPTVSNALVLIRTKLAMAHPKENAEGLCHFRTPIVSTHLYKFLELPVKEGSLET